MEYISDTLCHFVGRSKKTDDERFDLLCQIIKEKQLKANLKTPNNPSIQTSSGYRGEHFGEIFERVDCVCFCDIPDDMLAIHTSKYSRFGIGFSRKFLVEQGARPVTYVPLHARIKESAPTITPKSTPLEYFLYINNIAVYFNMIIMLLNQAVPFKNQLKQFIHNCPQSIQFLDSNMVQNVADGKTQELLFSETVALSTQNAYIKLFDETLQDDDVNNFYMEREWRSINSVEFSLNDIKKIYVPKQSYKIEFLKQFSDYSGGFVILNT